MNGVGIGKAKNSKYSPVPNRTVEEFTEEHVIELLQIAISFGMFFNIPIN
jgi:hypothetical protein